MAVAVVVANDDVGKGEDLLLLEDVLPDSVAVALGDNVCWRVRQLDDDD